MPVMVCMDGFILTHAYERVDVPTQKQVDDFLPPYEPRQVVDPDEPVTIGAMVGPDAFMEVRYLAHAKQMQALELIPDMAADFRRAFGRDSGGLLRTYKTEDAETIVRNADLAMYEAKRAGRACSVFFNDAMHTRLARNLTIETSLREALGTSQLSLVYQPIVELDTGRRSSVEALIRWNHPTLELQ